MNYRIAIVDDRRQNIISLSEKINYSGEVEIVFTAQNGSDYLDKMKRQPKDKLPQVVLMDIDMPVMNGIDAVIAGRQLYDEVKYIMLTVFDDDDKIFEAIRAGAGGYLLKEERVDVIIDSIKELLESGGAPMSPRIARKAMNLLMNSNSSTQSEIKKEKSDSTEELSERETEILKLLVDGYDHKLAAEKLFLSPHTVRKHIANIYAKLHVTSRAQVVKVAMKQGRA
ncbi:MAG: response regulator transcription factor [Bacteroidota bacterium]